MALCHCIGLVLLLYCIAQFCMQDDSIVHQCWVVGTKATFQGWVRMLALIVGFQGCVPWVGCKVWTKDWSQVGS